MKERVRKDICQSKGPRGGINIYSNGCMNISIYQSMR